MSHEQWGELTEAITSVVEDRVRNRIVNERIDTAEKTITTFIRTLDSRNLKDKYSGYRLRKTISTQDLNTEVLDPLILRALGSSDTTIDIEISRHSSFIISLANPESGNGLSLGLGAEGTVVYYLQLDTRNPALFSDEELASLETITNHRYPKTIAASQIVRAISGVFLLPQNP